MYDSDKMKDVLRNKEVGREHWTSQFGAFLALSGGAIGLGSLWLFPTALLYCGKSTFVYAYIFFTVILAIPISIGELIAGRHAQRSAVVAFFNYARGSRIIRYSGLICLLVLPPALAFYSSLSGYFLIYALFSLFDIVKSANAQDLWDNCIHSVPCNVFGAWGVIVLTVAIIYSGIKEGIEKWNRILLNLLFFMLIFILIGVSTLPQFSEACKIVLSFDLNEFNNHTLLASAGIALFSMCAGTSGAITYGSYMSVKSDIPKISFCTAFFVSLISILASIMYTTVALSSNVELTSDLGFVFVVLVEILQKTPFPYIFSFVFFAIFCFAAITSTVSILEIIVSNIMEIFEMSRRKISVLIGIFFMIITTPIALSSNPKYFSFNLVSLLAELVSEYLIPLAAIVTVLFIGWKLNKSLLKQEFMQNSIFKNLSNTWLFLIRFVAPIAILAIFALKIKNIL